METKKLLQTEISPLSSSSSLAPRHVGWVQDIFAQDRAITYNALVRTVAQGSKLLNGVDFAWVGVTAPVQAPYIQLYSNAISKA